ncbi:cytochrome c oxidase subunit 1 [Nowakowskiella sp. JEL0078]|nr:cytochrome c oxidase subunit 1 [Nowakowskiella sp. JEL0078]
MDEQAKMLHKLEKLTELITNNIETLSRRPDESRSHSRMNSGREPTGDDDSDNETTNSKRKTQPTKKITFDTSTRNLLEQQSTDSIEFTPITTNRPLSGDSTPQNSSPKHFSKLPVELISAGLAKSEMMRLSVVYELIDTEADFVRDLNVMLNFHKQQIKNARLLSEEDVIVLFSNTDQLVQVNQNFLDKLSARKEENIQIPELGDIILDSSELKFLEQSFKAYTVYCGNYPIAMKLVHSLQQNPEFKENLMKWMNYPEARGLSLESFLIKPVQRICKYPLLLRELIKYTDKTSKDYENLAKAAESIEAVVAMVNEATRALGEKEKIISLQSKIDGAASLYLENKKLMREGMIMKMISGKAKERYLILFSDLMLLCKIGGKSRYQLEMATSIVEIIIKADVKPGEGGIKSPPKFSFQLLLLGGKESIVFVCNDENDKNRWVDMFQESHKKTIEEQKKSGGAPFNSHRTSVDSSTVKKFNEQFGDLVSPEKDFGLKRNTIRGSGILRGKWGSIRREKNADNGPEGVRKNFLLKSSSKKIFIWVKLDGNFQANMDIEMDEDPELVEFNGIVWKKTLSAWQATYYYNSTNMEAIWKLPEFGVTILNPATGRPFENETDDL